MQYMYITSTNQTRKKNSQTSAIYRLKIAHPVLAQGAPPLDYSQLMTPGTSSIEKHMGGSDKRPMKSHDWSHAQPARLVGGDMDGNLS